MSTVRNGSGRRERLRPEVCPSPTTIRARKLSSVRAALMSISTGERVLLDSPPFPPYPTTERQAEFMRKADELAEVIAAPADEHDRNNSFPFDSFADLREAGYLALTVTEKLGGRGATPLEVMLAQERLARGNASVALGTTMHLSVVAGLVDNRAWPPDLFERVMR